MAPGPLSPRVPFKPTTTAGRPSGLGSVSQEAPRAPAVEMDSFWFLKARAMGAMEPGEPGLSPAPPPWPFLPFPGPPWPSHPLQGSQEPGASFKGKPRRGGRGARRNQEIGSLSPRFPLKGRSPDTPPLAASSPWHSFRIGSCTLPGRREVAAADARVTGAVRPQAGSDGFTEI